LPPTALAAHRRHVVAAQQRALGAEELLPQHEGGCAETDDEGHQVGSESVQVWLRIDLRAFALGTRKKRMRCKVSAVLNMSATPKLMAEIGPSLKRSAHD
jgi:hypothetical protein